MSYLKAIILFRSNKQGQKLFLCITNLILGCTERCVQSTTVEETPLPA